VADGVEQCGPSAVGFCEAGGGVGGGTELALPVGDRDRGLEAAKGEWLLLAASHNLRKLHGHLGITGLQALATG
jgi:hypothetical protein